MDNYNENEQSKINEIKDNIINLSYGKMFFEKQFEIFKNNKDNYIKKHFNRRIGKYVALPVTIVCSILFGITAITTSKIILAIILGNAITFLIVCRTAIKEIFNMTEEEYEKIYKGLSNQILIHEKKINELLKEYNLIVNKEINKEVTKVISNQKSNQVNVDMMVKTRKLERRR